MKFLLKIKHWQLFCMLYIMPFIIYICLIVYSVIANINTDAIFITIPVIFLVYFILYILFYFGWYYALGTNLYKKLPENVNMSIHKFKIFLFIPTIYISSIFILLSIMFYNINNIQEMNEMMLGIFPIIFLIVLPLHLFSMFCVFYCMYFISKALKSIEINNTAITEDYIGYFLMFWFIIIGIWFIQPKINRIFENE
ncbi:hypothetical protein GGR21_001111 [Dysgonomonas hofstadii]|uniref:Uncharacterized protein n=1 Tax=Dysgonomonas hofstadii TaxID=637886 RepID=A0A840CRR8_9BACT|nr:hypothetical protein [Dysgonomonas hofstadii]